MINWKVRFKNPHFIAQLIVAVLAPILAYMGISFEELTSWGKLGDVLFEALRNPYVLGLVAVNVYNVIPDPTTSGLGDSKQALTYAKPRKDK